MLPLGGRRATRREDSAIQTHRRTQDAGHARHARTNALVHDWVTRRGFDFFASEGFRSKSLTCVANTRGIDVADLVSKLKQRHRLAIDGGYGKLKGQTFRLSNMGDETGESVGELLDALDDCLET